MTLPALAYLIAAAALLVYGEVTYPRDMARHPVPPVVDPADSTYCGGFGPEWDALIARTAQEG